MNGHDEFLELVAASIDFELTDEEFGRLSTHLARCPDCRRAADEIRGGAAAIAALPAPALAPARAEQILRGALRTPPAKPRWGLLAVAAMLATLGGGILFAGFHLVNDDDSAPSEPPPSLMAEASTPPSAEPTVDPSDGVGAPPDDDGVRVTPDPGDESAPPIESAELGFPLPYSRDIGPIRVAPAPDDRLWVAFTRNNDTILALLDGAGRPLNGWPFVVPNASDCLPLVAPDGSVRLPCFYSVDPEGCVDVCGEDRVFAFDANGDPLAGFPVSFPFGFASGIDRQSARMVGDSVVLTGFEGTDDEDTGVPNERWITEIRSNGNVVLGVPVPAPFKCCEIGPSGIAYGSTVLEEEGQELRTQLVAFDAHGMRSGWPIVVDGNAVSWPSFGPNGQLVYTSWINESSRIARINADGSEATASIDLAFPIEWSPDGDAPIPPLVDERGRVWVVVDGGFLGYDASNGELPGFPYDAETGLLVRGADCDGGDTGCQTWVEPPRLAPQSLIYSLENAPAGKGARITVVNSDGSIRSGWPKTLKRAGSDWDSVTIGANRVAYAVANEPEPNSEASVTILAYAPNGTQMWKTTIVEP